MTKAIHKSMFNLGMYGSGGLEAMAIMGGSMATGMALEQ